LKRLIFVALGFKYDCHSLIDTAFEPAIEVSINAVERFIFVVTDVGVGLSGLISHTFDVVFRPILLSEQPVCVPFDQRGKPIAGINVLVGDMELFSELH
jgi:hypothetical protein